MCIMVLSYKFFSCISGNNIFLSAFGDVYTEGHDFNDIFLQWRNCEALPDETGNIVTVQTQPMYGAFESSKDDDNIFKRHEDFHEQNMIHCDKKEENSSDFDDRCRSDYNEEIWAHNEKVVVDMDHEINENTVIFPEFMDTNPRNFDLNANDIEREQATWDDRSENMLTAELLVNDEFKTDEIDQQNVTAAIDFVCEDNEMFIQKG